MSATSPKPRRGNGYYYLWVSLVVLLAAGLVWWFWDPIVELSAYISELAMDKDLMRQRMDSYGIWAPAVFVGFQVFQVLISPVPGELVGAVGGYVFGWWWAFVWSTVGLSLGSWINFFLARLMGERLVERMIGPANTARLTRFMERQGVIASFILFMIPGFPKDYYCYVLGLTPMNGRVFMFISSVGRIPGTLVLSLAGDTAFDLVVKLAHHDSATALLADMVHEPDFWILVGLLVLSLVFVIPVWLWRERIYQWVQRLDNSPDREPGA